MNTYRLLLERFFTDGRKPVFHVGRWGSSEVYEPSSQTFVQFTALPADVDVLQTMTAGVGLEAGLYLAEVPIASCYTDGWYAVFYHDLNQPDKGVFLCEWFQVSGGYTDPFPIATVEQVVSDIVTQLAGCSFSLQASFG